jgi:hypothetical protein
MSLHEVLKRNGIVATPFDGKQQRLRYLVEARPLRDMVVAGERYANTDWRLLLQCLEISLKLVVGTHGFMSRAPAKILRSAKFRS